MSKPVPLFVALIVPLIGVSVQAADLVQHQGFETCWTPALTKPVFLERLRADINGQSGCIPPQSGNQSGIDYTICNVPNGCGAAQPGCAVTLQSGTFSGDFPAGHFVAPGTGSNVGVPITAGFLGTCTLNITGITVSYALDYLVRGDGTDGVFTDELQTPTVDITSYSSNNNCNALIAGFIASYLPQAIVSAENGSAAAIEPALRANTLEQTICPLSE